jgi:transposase InsO family protein
MVAEGFVHTFKRDDVNIHELPDAESVLAQLGAWIDDYHRLAPHSALGMRRPADYARWRQRSVNSRRTWSSSCAR